MEKDLIKVNLGEAQEQLKDIINNLKNNDYDLTTFESDVEHMMQHINTAYNIRNWSKAQVDKDYNDKFNELIRVPSNNYFID